MAGYRHLGAALNPANSPPTPGLAELSTGTVHPMQAQSIHRLLVSDPHIIGLRGPFNLVLTTT